MRFAEINRELERQPLFTNGTGLLQTPDELSACLLNASDEGVELVVGISGIHEVAICVDPWVYNGNTGEWEAAKPVAPGIGGQVTFLLPLNQHFRIRLVDTTNLNH